MTGNPGRDAYRLLIAFRLPKSQWDTSWLRARRLLVLENKRRSSDCMT